MSDNSPFINQPFTREARINVPLSLSRIIRTSTRGDGTVQLGESFQTSIISFTDALPHLKIHHGEEIAGSQFNGDVFRDADDMVSQVSKLLPPELQYDQYGRAEVTLEVADNQGRPIGWPGVKSIDEIHQSFPGAIVEKKVRIPGGQETDDGVWYPEMRRTETGQWVISTDENGQIRNPHGKFEPKANIATIPAADFKKVAATNRITIIIQKDRESGIPDVLTVFPGDNAPSFPAKIESEDYTSDTTGDTPEAKFWDDHVFLKIG